MVTNSETLIAPLAVRLNPARDLSFTLYTSSLVMMGMASINLTCSAILFNHPDSLGIAWLACIFHIMGYCAVVVGIVRLKWNKTLVVLYIWGVIALVIEFTIMFGAVTDVMVQTMLFYVWNLIMNLLIFDVWRRLEMEVRMGTGMEV